MADDDDWETAWDSGVCVPVLQRQWSGADARGIGCDGASYG
jgi:hypothetical protein